MIRVFVFYDILQMHKRKHKVFTFMYMRYKEHMNMEHMIRIVY